MLHLLLTHFLPDDFMQNAGMWAFLAIGAIALFGIFLPVSTWLESRRKEREAFYRAETFRRVAEASTNGAAATLEFMREQNRIAQIRTREGMKMGGVINIGVGIGLIFFLHALVGPKIALCGLIPGLIGLGMLVYVYALAGPIE